MAWKYPSLYSLALDTPKSESVRDCVEASLWNNHFLHFAGSWYESLAWKIDQDVPQSKLAELSDGMQAFRSLPVKGKKLGQVFPNKSS
jgi:hypothetical protein